MSHVLVWQQFPPHIFQSLSEADVFPHGFWEVPLSSKRSASTLFLNLLFVSKVATYKSKGILICIFNVLC